MTKEKNQSRKQVYKCYFPIHQPLTQNPTQYPKCCDASHSWIPLRFPGGSFFLSSVSQSVAWSCWVTPGSWAHSCDSCPFVDTRRHRCCTGLQRAAEGLEWLWLRSKHSKITFIQHSIFKEIRKNHSLGVITLVLKRKRLKKAGILWCLGIWKIYETEAFISDEISAGAMQTKYSWSANGLRQSVYCSLILLFSTSSMTRATSYHSYSLRHLNDL